MVWEETPGWQYIGDAAFQDQVVQNVSDMIAAIATMPPLLSGVFGLMSQPQRSTSLSPHDRARQISRRLSSRSGSMTHLDNWETDWHEDVFAMDDYHQSPDGTVQIFLRYPACPTCWPKLLASAPTPRRV